MIRIATQKLHQGLYRAGIDIDEHETCPGLAMHFGEAVVSLVETTVETILLRDVHQFALRIIDPAVKAAGDNASAVPPIGFLPFFRDHCIAAV
jgi:hypothetical protein